MDLVTLIAACAIAPKSLSAGLNQRLMQAVIFEQSGGEPWAFAMPGEDYARLLPTLRDAVQQAQAARPRTAPIRVGLAGLSSTPQSVTATTFAPCPNVARAASQISQLVERCNRESKPDPLSCAVAAYHGSWDRPDTRFARAVRATVHKNNAPNFDMPDVGDFDAHDVVPGAMSSRRDAARTARGAVRKDQERAQSSGLFPAKPTTTDNTSTGVGERDHARAHSPRPGSETPATDATRADSLFFLGGSEPQP
jgi:hypothetical protein